MIVTKLFVIVAVLLATANSKKVRFGVAPELIVKVVEVNYFHAVFEILSNQDTEGNIQCFNQNVETVKTQYFQIINGKAKKVFRDLESNTEYICNVYTNTGLETLGIVLKTQKSVSAKLSDSGKAIEVTWEYDNDMTVNNVIIKVDNEIYETGIDGKLKYFEINEIKPDHKYHIEVLDDTAENPRSYGYATVDTPAEPENPDPENPSRKISIIGYIDYNFEIKLYLESSNEVYNTSADGYAIMDTKDEQPSITIPIIGRFNINFEITI